ncbi:MAG: hypothetical protein ACR2HR_15310 [Euzebya sp.]
MTKVCTVCHEPRPEADFHRNIARPDGLQTVCKECKKAYNAIYYLGNADRHRALRALHRRRLAERNREVIKDAKKVSCADCGQSFPSHAMDFDHVTGEKLGDVAWMRSTGLRRLQEEISKCEVVCVNCHRARTKDRRESQKAGADGLE